MEIFLFFLIIFLIWFSVAVYQVKSGKKSTVFQAMADILKEFWRYCNTSDVPVTSGVIYPLAIDERLWLGWEKKIKNKFVDVDFSTFVINNGVCGAEFSVIQSANSDIKILRQMLEKSLRNYLLTALNLHNQTFFSIFVHISGHILTVYYAINETGVQFIEQQKFNERSRKR